MPRLTFVPSALALSAALTVAAPAALARPAPAWLEIYGLYATPSGGRLLGRAHRGAPPPAPASADGVDRTVLGTLRALEGAALARVPVRVAVGALEGRVVSDGRGYFELPLPAGIAPGAAAVIARLDSPRYAAAEARFALPVLDDGDDLGVITDVDDTLVDTRVRDRLHMVAVTLAGGGPPFPGAAAALGALVGPPAGAAARARPLVYVSGSPWSLLARLTASLHAAGFPAGPMLLKRFSVDPLTDQMAYKYPRLVALVDALPRRRWILLGDSGESDPEVYDRLRRERPGRVAAVYIHLVTDELPGAPRFRGMTAFRAWSEVLDDAGRRGLVPAAK